MIEKSIITSKTSTKSTHIIREKTRFDKFSAGLKNLVFQVLYFLLPIDEDNSLLEFILLVGVDYLQMTAFFFNSNTKSLVTIFCLCVE